MTDIERYGGDDFDDDVDGDFDGDFDGDMPVGRDPLAGLLGQAQNALAQAQAMQSQEIEGSAGGGSVRIVVNGAMEFKSVTIDRQMVDSSDIDLLEDLVLAALNDATNKLRAGQAELQQRMLGGLGGLGDLGKLFGGG